MVFGVFGLLAIILLVMTWVRAELSLVFKLVLTGIYVATWLLAFVDGWALMVLQGVFALGLYFFLFPSGGGRRWRP
jgi:hypothetical protein